MINNICLFPAMKYLAAYALLALSGKQDITSDDVKKVLGEAQVKTDE
jgi:ribosomal protein L12E/L44/L45/RPP1/RPP2